MSHFKHAVLTGTIAVSTLSQAKQVENEVILWNKVVMEAFAEGQHPPPANARGLAVLSIAQFDALNSIHGKYKSYAFNKPTKGVSEEAAVIGASLTVIREMYTARQSAANKLYQARKKALGDSKAVKDGFALGVESAKTILKLRENDGHFQAEYSYESQNRIGEYREPIGADIKIPTPGWGEVKPFCIKKGSDFRPNPIFIDSPVYLDSFDEVKRLGGKDSTERSPDQSQTARFWNFGTKTVSPPGAWNEIAALVSTQKGVSLYETSRLYALLNIAMADAGIAAWDAKYWYVLWRPQTAIWLADQDSHPETKSDPNWKSFIPTPNHPSYVSGHSAFSMAAAVVLMNFFKTDSVKFTYQGDRTRIKTVRSYWNFTSAAKEAGRSRVFGGIHYQFDNIEGRDMGSKIGQAVFDMELQPVGK